MQTIGTGLLIDVWRVRLEEKSLLGNFKFRLSSPLLGFWNKHPQSSGQRLDVYVKIRRYSVFNWGIIVPANVWKVGQARFFYLSLLSMILSMCLIKPCSLITLFLPRAAVIIRSASKKVHCERNYKLHRLTSLRYSKLKDIKPAIYSVAFCLQLFRGPSLSPGLFTASLRIQFAITLLFMPASHVFTGRWRLRPVSGRPHRRIVTSWKDQKSPV